MSICSRISKDDSGLEFQVAKEIYIWTLLEQTGSVSSAVPSTQIFYSSKNIAVQKFTLLQVKVLLQKIT